MTADSAPVQQPGPSLQSSEGEGTPSGRPGAQHSAEPGTATRTATHTLPGAAAKVAAEAAGPEARETAFTSKNTVREAKEIAASCAVSLPERRHSVSPVSHSPPPPVP